MTLSVSNATLNEAVQLLCIVTHHIPCPLLQVIIGVAAAACLLVLAVIGILILYKRKSSESSRVLKNMQEQMDVLELRVAAECKEGTVAVDGIFSGAPIAEQALTS